MCGLFRFFELIFKCVFSKTLMGRVVIKCKVCCSEVPNLKFSLQSTWGESRILLLQQTASLSLGTSFPHTMLWNSLQRWQLAQHGAGCCANYPQYSISAYHPLLWNTNLKIKHFIKMWIVGLLFNFSLFGFWSELRKQKQKKRVRNNISRSVILEESHWGGNSQPLDLSDKTGMSCSSSTARHRHLHTFKREIQCIPSSLKWQ